MRTCFVHIGMHKTGSTAIQAALHGYDDGKTVVLQTGQPNHSTPLLMMFSTDPRRAAKRIGIRVGRLEDRLQSLRKRIVSQFEASHIWMARRYGQHDFDFSDRLYEAALAGQADDIAWAEQLLQRKFPLRHRPENAVVFDSHDEILQYATRCRGTFDDWERRQFGMMRRLSFLVRALRRKTRRSAQSRK